MFFLVKNSTNFFFIFETFPNPSNSIFVQYGGFLSWFLKDTGFKDFANFFKIHAKGTIFGAKT